MELRGQLRSQMKFGNEENNMREMEFCGEQGRSQMKFGNEENTTVPSGGGSSKTAGKTPPLGQRRLPKGIYNAVVPLIPKIP